MVSRFCSWASVRVLLFACFSLFCAYLIQFLLLFFYFLPSRQSIVLGEIGERIFGWEKAKIRFGWIYILMLALSNLDEMPHIDFQMICQFYSILNVYLLKTFAYIIAKVNRLPDAAFDYDCSNIHSISVDLFSRQTFVKLYYFLFWEWVKNYI